MSHTYIEPCYLNSNYLPPSFCLIIDNQYFCVIKSLYVSQFLFVFSFFFWNLFIFSFDWFILLVGVYVASLNFLNISSMYLVILSFEPYVAFCQVLLNPVLSWSHELDNITYQRWILGMIQQLVNLPFHINTLSWVMPIMELISILGKFSRHYLKTLHIFWTCTIHSQVNYTINTIHWRVTRYQQLYEKKWNTVAPYQWGRCNSKRPATPSRYAVA
jgi:hypothetical protein